MTLAALQSICDQLIWSDADVAMIARYLPEVMRVAAAAEQYVMAREPQPVQLHAVSAAVLAMRQEMQSWESQ